LIKKLKSEGYFLLIISGSHHELIEPLADYYGFDDWIGSQYFRRDGRFSGKKHIPSMQKDLALKDFVTKHKLTFTGSMGIGDSGSDIAMLELVEQPIAFNPDKVLLETAKKHGWKVVVERKNVVYELEAHDGSYILA
jgi:phosphoserine phosphatase